MASERPKQYLELLGRPLIWHALQTFCDSPQIEKVFVVLSVGDVEWNRYEWQALGPKLVPLFCGGPSRADSVLNGLRTISDQVSQSDWLLVHDAARPCLASWQLQKLIHELQHHEVGGLLAVPVADTLKRTMDTGMSRRPCRATACGRRRHHRCSATSCCDAPSNVHGR